MGQVKSIPEEELTQLLELTHFKKNDLKAFYKNFMKTFPSGQMNESQFCEIYGKLLSTDANMAAHIFRSFDHNNDGVISFRELMTSLSLMSTGSREEKLEWLFNVYDYDGNGRITMDEVRDLGEAIEKAWKSEPRRKRCLHHEEDDDEDEDFISCIFEDVDHDGNGYWTLDEFVEGVKDHPVLMKVMEVTPADK